ncbi:hypothetical protein MJD09_27540, partial [bacterium]|nr:hypothetical protein [bacterium]
MKDLRTQLEQIRKETGYPTKSLQITEKTPVQLYPNSVCLDGDVFYFIAVQNGQKWLWIGPSNADAGDLQDFNGES